MIIRVYLFGLRVQKRWLFVLMLELAIYLGFIYLQLQMMFYRLNSFNRLKYTAAIEKLYIMFFR